MSGLFPGIPTPALIVEKSVLESNISRVAGFARSNRKVLRPHVKTHKSPVIAGLQKKAGIAGITVATLAEAEAFRSEGFGDIFLAYPVVGPDKLERLSALHRSGRTLVAVDHPFHLEELEREFRDPEKPLEIRLEIDSGLGRCGIETPQILAELVARIRRLPGIRLEGLFTHGGKAYSARSREEVGSWADRECRSVIDSAGILAKEGFSGLTLSVGSTPTLEFSSNYPAVSELRPGNYVFNDGIQVSLGTVRPEQCSLEVLATVVSVYSDRFVIDAGSKMVGLDRGIGDDKTPGFGLFRNRPGWNLARLSEEHGVVTVVPGSVFPTPGERLRFIPNHACVAVNLSSGFFLVDGERVILKSPVLGRH